MIIRNGIVYDGTGEPGRRVDVGIRGDRVASLGDLAKAAAAAEIDAGGRAVAPGFINVLSWANEALIVNGRGMSDLKQGVTLEIFGKGESGGPPTEPMKAEIRKEQRDYDYDIDWTSLGGFLESLERRGVSPNVASFVGATTLRVHELGEGDRDPTTEELARTQDLVRDVMREGALGVGSSLIYSPAFFAETPERIAPAKAASEFGGGYVSHARRVGYDRTDRAGPRRRAAGQREHVYVHGRRDRTRWRHAAVVAGWRPRRLGGAAEGSGAAVARYRGYP